MELLTEVKRPDLDQALSIGQGDYLAPPATRLTKYEPEEAVVTFDKLLKETDFAELIQEMVQTVADAYGRPVDMEFAYEDGKIYVLQCRTLSLAREDDHVAIPTGIDPERVIFTARSGLPNRVIADLEYAVYVDPPVLRQTWLIGRTSTTWARSSAGSTRPWPSNGSPFWARAGGAPTTSTWGSRSATTTSAGPRSWARWPTPPTGSPRRVSFGTHFFNDLVEADIVPPAPLS